MAAGGVKAPKKRKRKQAGHSLPPFLSYDPAINAERRALGRGLKDLERDSRRDYARNRKDLATRLTDLQTTKARGSSDFATRLQEGLRDLGLRRQDLATDASRTREDFSTQLTNLVRGFNTLGGQQAQSANAAGVLGGSTMRASAARRASNLRLAREPIDTGSRRLEEDYTRNVGRLGIAESDLRSDVARGQTRLLADVDRDFNLARRDFRQAKTDIGTRLQRGRRERAFGDLDKRQEAIFQARQLRPGAFNAWGRRKR